MNEIVQFVTLVNEIVILLAAAADGNETGVPTVEKIVFSLVLSGSVTKTLYAAPELGV